ncbi:MAG: cytochrome c biogenesis protein CcsA, partial [Acidimicrobiales bacterium]
MSTALGPAALWATVILATGAAAVGGRWSRRLLGAATATAILAVAALAWAFLTADWRWLVVVDNTRGEVGPLLRLSGLWAGPEGSLLVWTAMVAVAAVLAARLAPPGAATVTARLGAGLVAAYAAVTATTAWPFTRLDAPPADGLGLQPVLEHPAMVWHPPLLYAGLVAMLAGSLLAGGAAITPGARAPEPRVWRVSLTVLAAVQVNGSLWDGVELGWGGYWALDPIESAGLVACLTGDAALHAARPGGRPVVVGRAAVAVAVAPGVTAVGATTLTRIGVVSSVHAFANQPGLRAGLLVAAGLVLIGAVAVVARSRPGPGPVSAPATGTPTWPGTGTGRRWAVAATASAATLVAIGTYWPVAEWLSGGDAVAVAGPYFTRLLAPVVLVAAVGVVTVDHRQLRSPATTGRATPRWLRTTGPAAGATLGVTLVWSVVINPAPAPSGPGPGAAGTAVLVAAAGGAVLGSSLVVLRARSGRPGALAHAGVGLLLIGVAGTVGAHSPVIAAAPDRPVVVDGMTVTHRGVDLDRSGGVTSAIATVDVDGRTYHPSLVTFPQRGASTVETATRFLGADEVQVVLIDGSASLARYRVTRIPRIGLVWLGVAVATIGLAGPSTGRRA